MRFASTTLHIGKHIEPNIGTPALQDAFRLYSLGQFAESLGTYCFVFVVQMYLHTRTRTRTHTHTHIYTHIYISSWPAL